MNVLEHYQAHGWARLGQTLDEETLAALRERALDLMLGRVSWPGLFFQMDAATGDYRDAPLGLGWQGPSLKYRKLEKLELDDRFRALIRHPALLPVVQRLIPGALTLYRAIIFNKAAETGGTEVPWHQDAGKLWGLSADPDVQVWTALDDAPEDGGCLEVVPGSHQWGLASPLGGVVGESLVQARNAEALALALPARAGESLLVHNLVWHRSRRSVSGQRRLGFSACYLPATTQCVRRHKKQRLFFPVTTSPGPQLAPRGGAP